MSLLSKSWKYINEGNVHIVLKIDSTNYVLRLIKEDDEKTDLQFVRTSTEFVNKVMIPLFSLTNLATYDIIEIPENELNHVIKCLEDIRPKQRQIKSKLSCYAIRASNLLIISPQCVTNYCVEIKPKEGFMPASLKDSSKCFYCLKQYLKLHEKQINKVSEYCPLDLFSGNKQRMKCALLNLMDNPQNNFKFFRNETVIFNEKSSAKDYDNILKEIPHFGNSINVFIDFVIEILLSSNNQDVSVKRSNDMLQNRNKKDKCIESIELPTDSFLYKLLSIQKLSERYDLETESLPYSTDYVSAILDHLDLHTLDLSSEISRKEFYESSPPLHLAMISAVAKDCSIMISFSFDAVEGFPTITLGDNKASYRVSVTDLEPKSTKTLVKRKKNEKELLDIYQMYKKSLDMDK